MTRNILTPSLEVLAKELDQFKAPLIDILFECALALPTKTSLYGTLIGLLNTKAPEVGKEVYFKSHVFFLK